MMLLPHLRHPKVPTNIDADVSVVIAVNDGAGMSGSRNIGSASPHSRVANSATAGSTLTASALCLSSPLTKSAASLHRVSNGTNHCSHSIKRCRPSMTNQLDFGFQNQGRNACGAPAVVAAIVADNAANLQCAATVCGVPVIHCGCHVLQLGVAQYVEATYQNLIDICLAGVTSAKDKGKKLNSISRIVPTRWWTQVLFLESVKANWGSLLESNSINNNKWLDVEKALEDLGALRTMGRILEKDATTLPMYAKIIGSLLVSPSKREMVVKFAKHATFPALILTAALSPAFDADSYPPKRRFIYHNDQLREVLESIVRILNTTRSQQTTFAQYNSQLLQFLTRERSMVFEDPPNWADAWAVYTPHYPDLLHVARCLDRVTSSEASVERSFSSQKYLVGDYRQCLTAGTVVHRHVCPSNIYFRRCPGGKGAVVAVLGGLDPLSCSPNSQTITIRPVEVVSHVSASHQAVRMSPPAVTT